MDVERVVAVGERAGFAPRVARERPIGVVNALESWPGSGSRGSGSGPGTGSGPGSGTAGVAGSSGAGTMAGSSGSAGDPGSAPPKPRAHRARPESGAPKAAGPPRVVVRELAMLFAYGLRYPLAAGTQRTLSTR
jgi:hypothetical protein